MSNQQDITLLLKAWTEGDERALEKMTPLVYTSLQKIARQLHFRESADLTLQSTEIVHEAFLRLVNTDIDWQNRAHFYAIAARIMRRLLVDHARAKKSDKRGGDITKLTFGENMVIQDEASNLLIDFERALDKLSQLDERKCEALSLHVFGGLTVNESAEVLGVSHATIERDLSFAKAWIGRELGSTTRSIDE